MSSLFLYLLLINLPLLASLDERSIHRKFDCFLTAGDNKLEVLKGENLVGRLIWLILGGCRVCGRGSLILLPRMRLESLFFCLLYLIALTVIFWIAIINGYCQSIYVLEQGWLPLFPDGCYSTRVWTDFGLGLGLGP